MATTKKTLNSDLIQKAMKEIKDRVSHEKKISERIARAMKQHKENNLENLGYSDLLKKAMHLANDKFNLQIEIEELKEEIERLKGRE